jgi:hypothetical protein
MALKTAMMPMRKRKIRFEGHVIGSKFWKAGRE